MYRVTRASIIVPAYNVAEFLPRCVESLLAQTETSIEIIVVNDGSSDGLTAAIADGFAQQDARVRVLHRENSGVSAARNAGLCSAVGDYVFFVDSDDWAEPAMVESMIATCESTGAEVSVAGAYVDCHDRDEHLARSELRLLPEALIDRDEPIDGLLVTDNFVNLLGYVWNKAYRRGWLIDQGNLFEEGQALFEDLEFNSKVLRESTRTALMPRAYVHYVQRPRATLGTTVDESFMVKRLRAIRCMESLLLAWKLDAATVVKRSARSSSGAVWAAVLAASRSPRPRATLRRMLSQPGARDLIELARIDKSLELRRRWATAALHRTRYSAALAPALLQGGLKRLSSWWRRESQPTEGRKQL